MITKEDIKEAFGPDANWVKVGALVLELLKERDEALRRGNAYREAVYVISGETKSIEIDKEAAKILEREAKSKEGR